MAKTVVKFIDTEIEKHKFDQFKKHILTKAI